tara:strand:- start:827 stop:1228 length:402 start_codon:yes stop_codon:yes gene_type:complete
VELEMPETMEMRAVPVLAALAVLAARLIPLARQTMQLTPARGERVEQERVLPAIQVLPAVQVLLALLFVLLFRVAQVAQVAQVAPPVLPVIMGGMRQPSVGNARHKVIPVLLRVVEAQAILDFYRSILALLAV